MKIFIFQLYLDKAMGNLIKVKNILDKYFVMKVFKNNFY